MISPRYLASLRDRYESRYDDRYESRYESEIVTKVVTKDPRLALQDMAQSPVRSPHRTSGAVPPHRAVPNRTPHSRGATRTPEQLDVAGFRSVRLKGAEMWSDARRTNSAQDPGLEALPGSRLWTTPVMSPPQGDGAPSRHSQLFS